MAAVVSVAAAAANLAVVSGVIDDALLVIAIAFDCVSGVTQLQQQQQ